MSWLATAVPVRTLGDALALRPELLSGCRALEAALAAEPSLDAAMRARCRARVATLFGASATGEAASPTCQAASATHDAAAVPVSPAADVVLEFVEQFVLDAQGMSDALVARLGAVLSPRAIVALAQSVAVWEAEHRLARCLEVTPEL
jgi:hypothetical protein